MRFLHFVNELKDIQNIESLDKSSERQNIVWSHGTLYINPDRMDLFRGKILFPVQFILNFKKKEVLTFPMDDWSDFKNIKAMQQAMMDMIRAKIIDKNWKAIIGSEGSTKKTLGSTKVGEILKLDFDFNKYVPFAFHGTSDFYLEEIERFGLEPSTESMSRPNWNMGYTDYSEQNVYLSIDYDRAKYYAKHTVEFLKKELNIKSKPIVVQINKLPMKNVVADDDLLTNMGRLQLLFFIHKNSKKESDLTKPISGIRISGQFAYKGTIKPNMITKIHKV